MKRVVFSFVCFVIMISMLVLTVIPASAESDNPYGTTSVGCITNIEMESRSSLLGGVDYFTSIVTSRIQGLEERDAIPYRTFGAIGNENTRMFVYSVGSDNNLDFARASTKAIVERFEEENPAWDAVVAINGDFFDIETVASASMGEPEFPMIQMGNSYKTNVLTAATGRGIVGTTPDGEMLYYTLGRKYQENGYGTEITYSKSYMLQILGEHRTNAIAEYPAYPDNRVLDYKVSFITPDSSERSFAGCKVYVVKCDTYRRAHVGINGNEMGTTGYFIEGEIVEIREGKASEKPPQGYVYFAVKQPEVFELLKVGAYVKCQKTLDGAWENVDNAIGFKQQILANGNLLLKNAYGTYNPNGDYSTVDWTEDIYDYPFCWKNRTAIGFKEDGTPILLVLQKSLHTGNYKNIGASYYEIAEQLKALGCVNGFLLDGGGSSTFVTRNEDGTFENAFVGEGTGRSVANAVILAVRDESVPLPELDAEVEVKLPVIEPTEKATKKPKTKATEAEKIDVTEQSSEEPVDSINGGCGSVIAMPALVVSACVSVILLSEKRKKR
ncbi:MAG: phosphodiester glycosidase family protein [Clostridia bacterium]|nr:phosphodiester glycosidase family protein [Clostridia bacterium]